MKMAKFYMARQLKMSSEEETANCMKFANCENVGKVEMGFKISYKLNVLN